MNNYQQRIRERAEQFYTRIFPIYSHSITLENSPWNAELLNIAKLSVDAEAEAYTMGWRDGSVRPKDEAGKNMSLKDMLLFFGLIAPPENSEQGGRDNE